ncbi:Inositol 1,4,5-trisphosphate receptor type 1 [Fukomys damarensis]|uniref:Inositol 1,4,5-trisphosphate receptor type 1 n=1 Tax=Fukomys damarensis TaxID=885580 RepID=A0A091CT43_FUKDA|nr:Inositol 1,4,5-trisphosphate receptor type 1 [Fukomys damarensis]
MSLVSSDSEGEQNELRNLQEKLESTMKLVTNLSGQLSELKDQAGVKRKELQKKFKLVSVFVQIGRTELLPTAK